MDTLAGCFRVPGIYAGSSTFWVSDIAPSVGFFSSWYVQCTCSALCLECRGFESHPRQLIFLRKSDCLVNILYYMPASVVFEFLEYMPAPVHIIYIFFSDIQCSTSGSFI